VLRLYVAVILEYRQPEAESKYALEAARRYHQWTVSELMSYLEQAAAKNGCTLVAVDPAHTTRRCAECGELIVEKMVKLVLTCPNGHASDQDANAARNIFSKMTVDPKQNEQLRTLTQRCNIEPCVIPDILRSVAVEVLPE